MKYFDQHIHSNYSSDSNEPLENYISLAISQGRDYFVTTDHFDLNIANSGESYIADYKKEKIELQKLQLKYPNINLMLGIEIGYKRKYLKEMNDVIHSQDFSLINLSVHDYEDINFYLKEEYINRGIDNVLNLYFDLCLEAVMSFKEFDVFSHFDYAFKCAKSINPEIEIHSYEGKIKKLFALLIKEEKVLEINTKVQEKINDESYIRYILKTYKKLGGKYLSLSSDAHNAKRFMSSFEKYISIIKQCGFDKLTVIINHKKYLIEI